MGWFYRESTSPQYLNHTDYVKQFQVIQKKDLSITIKVKTYSDDDSLLIKKFIDDELGKRINNQVACNIDFVSEIYSEKGKLRFIIKE